MMLAEAICEGAMDHFIANMLELLMLWLQSLASPSLAKLRLQ
jgi:hypothetical protein